MPLTSSPSTLAPAVAVEGGDGLRIRRFSSASHSGIAGGRTKGAMPAPRASAALTAAELAQYRELGFVVVRGALLESDLAPIDAAYERQVAAVAERLLAEGRIADGHASLPHDRRLAALIEELGPDEYDGFQIHELSGEWPAAFDIYQARLRPTFDFMFSERLGDAVASLLGTEELTVHPSQHVRPYLPRRDPGAPQPNQAAWHQYAAPPALRHPLSITLSLSTPLGARSG